MEWATVGRLIKTTVTVRNGEDATEVRVRVDASGAAAFTRLGFGGFGVLVGGIVAATSSRALPWAWPSMLGIGGGLGVGLDLTRFVGLSKR